MLRDGDYVSLIDEYVDDCHTDAGFRRRTFAALTAERLGDPAAGRAVADVYRRCEAFASPFTVGMKPAPRNHPTGS